MRESLFFVDSLTLKTFSWMMYRCSWFVIPAGDDTI